MRHKFAHKRSADENYFPKIYGVITNIFMVRSTDNGCAHTNTHKHMYTYYTNVHIELVKVLKNYAFKQSKYLYNCSTAPKLWLLY